MVGTTNRRAALLLAIIWAAFGCGSKAASRETSTAPPQSAEAGKPSPTSKQHSVLKVIADPYMPMIPRVWLSAGHAKQCKVGVGEAFPDLKLPQLGGDVTDLATLRGKQATVVLFWHPDRWMARTALIDVERDVAKKLDPEDVSIVGIAVHQPEGSLQSLLGEANVSFPQLLDTAGDALAQVGTFALPRIYVLDSEGTIVWFDIEYSEATRRELQQTLLALKTTSEN